MFWIGCYVSARYKMIMRGGGLTKKYIYIYNITNLFNTLLA